MRENYWYSKFLFSGRKGIAGTYSFLDFIKNLVVKCITNLFIFFLRFINICIAFYNFINVNIIQIMILSKTVWKAMHQVNLMGRPYKKKNINQNVQIRSFQHEQFFSPISLLNCDCLNLISHQISPQQISISSRFTTSSDKEAEYESATRPSSPMHHVKIYITHSYIHIIIFTDAHSPISSAQLALYEEIVHVDIT